MADGKAAGFSENPHIWHIAFIMDGNGRWATKRLLPREVGHRFGAETFRKIVRYCADIGIHTVTVYAFSTENWKRPAREVDAIMSLLGEFLNKYRHELIEMQVRLHCIGDLSPLSENLQERIRSVEAETAGFERELNIALNYGGRSEIVRACNRLIASGKTVLTEEDMTSAMDTAGQKDPDLIVRTGGEHRTSNFLMWQSAYSEWYVTDALWPDMTERDVDAAIENFKQRKRRFGGV